MMENKKSYSKIKSETFNIEKAIERLKWRFTNENVKPNESKITINNLDIKAVEFLNEWVNQQKKETLKENILFAKLYCYALSNELEFYKDVKFANRKLQEELKKPILNHYEKINDDLNRLNLNNYLKSIGIKTDHLERCLMSNEENEKEAVLTKENNKTIQKYIKGIILKENTFKSINNTISECINKYKNLK